MEEVAIRGGCLCKAITYTILPPTDEELEKTDPDTISSDGRIQGNHCHCDTCRNSSGALFQTLAQIPMQRINIVDSRKSLSTYRVFPNAEREHCAICGTTMWIKDTGWDDPVKGYINVSVGSMNKEDAKKWVSLRHHIFLGDTIDGGVWQFEDNLPKSSSFEVLLTLGMKHGLIRGNGRGVIERRLQLTGTCQLLQLSQSELLSMSKKIR